MISTSIKKILIDENFKIDNARDKELQTYIMWRGKKELLGVSGYVDDEIVIGWARHFYLESQESINEEMGSIDSVSDEHVDVEKLKTSKLNSKKYIDKETGKSLIQESLF